MRSGATARLIAQTDTTCEFLLNFLKRHEDSGLDKIQKHIRIDNDVLDSKIAILKESGLIHNRIVTDENGNFIRKVFSLSDEGRNALIELGYDF